MLTITTTAAASLGVLGGVDPVLPGPLMLAGLGVVVVIARRREIAAPLRRLGLVALMASGGLALNGCGGSDGGDANGNGNGPGAPGSAATTPGSYTVVITATDGSVTRSINYTLVVN